MEGLALTWFEDRKGLTARPIRLPWPRLVERLQEVPPQPVKDNSPLLKLATFGDIRTEKDCLRHDGNVLEVTGVEGDHDSGEVSLEKAVSLLERWNLKAAVLPSWSHTPEEPRWRVYAPLSRPVKPEERRRYVAALNGILGGILAPESFTLSQSFYVGPRPGGEYRVLATFEDPEEGLCLDQLA